MSFFSTISSFFAPSASSGTGANRSRTLTSTHDAFSLPTHSPGSSYRNDGQFSYPPPAAYSPSPTSYDYMPPATRDNFRRSTLPTTSPIASTWERIRKFLNREYPELGDSLNYGITPAILAQVETELGMTLPRSVRESYMLCDGQEAESGTACAEGLFYGLTLLPLEDVLEEWRFWREVDEDPSTGANPQLLQVMASIPPGWIRKAYSCRGWLPLVTDKAGNYLGIDLAPAEQGAYGQVIVFGRDFDTKVVMFRGEGEDGWATWLQSFAEELENGDGYEVGANDSASDGSDDVGYESYFYDGSGRSKGVGGARDGAAGIKLTGEYKGWNVLEAFADRSYRRWRERDMAPDLDALRNELPPQNVQLVGPSVGTGSGVEVPIPIMGGSAPPTPSISITRAGAPQPLHLPTQADILPPTAERAFAPDDVEAGMGAGMEREAVPLREMSLDSVTTKDTSDLATPIASKPPVVLGASVAEPSLMDAPPSPAPIDSSDPLGLAGAALVPVPPPSEDEAAELDESNAPPTTIRLVGTEAKADSDNDSRASIDSKGKKKRFSKGLSKLGLKKKDEA